MEYIPTTRTQELVDPLVSVCITTYNHEKFIRECLDSVLAQKTEFPIEIILGEDNSTDGTREICKEYAERYPDIIRLFLREEKDKIIINGRKTGRFNFVQNLKDARGKYIALCDGDDYWSSITKLQDQFAFLEENNEYVMCGGTSCQIFENEDYSVVHPLQDKWGKSFDLNTSIIIQMNPFSTLTYFFRNGLVNEFPDVFYKGSGADRRLLILLSRHGKLRFVNKSYGVYRIHSGSVTSWTRKNNSKKNIEQLKKRIETVENWNKYLDYEFDTESKTILLKLLTRLKRSYVKQFNFLAVLKVHLQLKKLKKSIK